MKDLGIVPVGFNEALDSIYKNKGSLPAGPISFRSGPLFELYRSPKTNKIEPLSGLALLSSRVLYKLFTPKGSNALDTNKGSLLESRLGTTFDKAGVTVDLVRAVQDVELDMLSKKSVSVLASNLEEELAELKVSNILFIEPDTVELQLTIKSAAGKVASLQVEV